VLAGLRESCERLGVPMGTQTGTAYALGVLHAIEELDNHLGESRCLAMHLLVLYSRAALIADATPEPTPGGGRVTARRRTHEDWVREQACRLGDDLIALQAIVPRTGAAVPSYGRNGSASPPSPVREDVLDLQREIEKGVLWLRFRAAVLLGRKVPRKPLSQRFFYPCPYCEANSLWIEPDGWYVLCGNPECRDPQGHRYEWHNWTEIEHLRDIVAALIAEHLDSPEAREEPA
jgi:hypothetical protein